jgi:hypothetical protein
MRCNYKSHTSTVYSYIYILTVCSFTQYNLSSILDSLRAACDPLQHLLAASEMRACFCTVLITGQTYSTSTAPHPGVSIFFYGKIDDWVAAQVVTCKKPG